MKIILKEDIAKIGKKYDVKDVASGFARNFLIPRGKAERATEHSILRVESLRKKSEEVRVAQTKDIRALSGTEFKMTAKASEKDSLFAGISKEEILVLIKKEKGIDVSMENLVLQEPIKKLGSHIVQLHADGNKVGEITIQVDKE